MKTLQIEGVYINAPPSDYIVSCGVWYCNRRNREAKKEGNFKTAGYYHLFDRSTPASSSGSAAQRRWVWGGKKKNAVRLQRIILALFNGVICFP